MHRKSYHSPPAVRSAEDCSVFFRLRLSFTLVVGGVRRGGGSTLGGLFALVGVLCIGAVLYFVAWEPTEEAEEFLEMAESLLFGELAIGTKFVSDGGLPGRVVWSLVV